MQNLSRTRRKKFWAYPFLRGRKDVRDRVDGTPYLFLRKKNSQGVPISALCAAMCSLKRREGEAGRTYFCGVGAISPGRVRSVK